MPLPATGERFLPEMSGQMEMEHAHRYFLTKEWIKGKVVLDIASGEGYGSALLATAAKRVTGVDISDAAVAHAQNKYRARNLKYVVGSAASIPLKAKSVEVVVSFETIEHLTEHDEMMREIRRVLKPNGLLIISSPDRLEYSDKPGYANPYHVKELYRAEFQDLIESQFKNVSMLGQRVVFGSCIAAEEGPTLFKGYDGGMAGTQMFDGLPFPTYWIAVASDGPLPTMQSGFWNGDLEGLEVVRGLKAEISTLARSAEPLVRLDLYVGVEGAFTEANKFSTDVVLNGAAQHISITVPAQAGACTGLRLDPSDCPSLLNIARIQVIGAQGQTLWPTPPHTATFRDCSSHLYIIRTSDEGLRLACFSGDPFVHLDLPSNVLDEISEHGAVVQVTMSGRKIDDKALLEIADHKLLVSGDVLSQAQAQEGTGVDLLKNALTETLQSFEQARVNGLARAVESISGLVETSRQLVAAQSEEKSQLLLHAQRVSDQGVAREQALLTQLPTLTGLAESLQHDLRLANARGLEEQARLQAELAAARSQHVEDVAKLRAELDSASALHSQALAQREETLAITRDQHVQVIADLKIDRGGVGMLHNQALEREQLLLAQVANLTSQTELLQHDLRDSQAKSIEQQSQLRVEFQQRIDVLSRQGEALQADIRVSQTALEGERASRATMLDGMRSDLATLMQRADIAEKAMVAQREQFALQQQAIIAEFNGVRQEESARADKIRSELDRQVSDTVQRAESLEARLLKMSGWRGFRFLSWINRSR
jgi:SAM-dependent methyltransferase